MARTPASILRLGALRCLGAAALCIPPGPAPAQPTASQTGVTVTYLASEGVMLSAGGRKVLIDALFRKYETGYAVPADSTQRALSAARPPFDGVDLVLVTHRHGDHFHPAPVAAHLAANPRATLLASRQVIDSLRAGVASAAALAPRLVARTTAPGTRRREVIAGIPVELLGLRHTGRWRHRRVEHLGFIVELGGRRVLHAGDAEVSEEAFAPLRLDTMRIDVALLPAWAATTAEGRKVVARWIRPRHVVAIHAPDGAMAARLESEVRAAMPGAITFTRSLETRRW